MHKILIATLAAGVMAAGVAQSATQTTTASFQVTASVAAICSASAGPLAFPGYTPGAGAVTGSTNVVVKCTKGTSFTVALNAGSTAGASVAQRLMTNGAASTLQYNLYTANSLGTIFGDGSGVGGSQTVTTLGAGVAAANAVSVPVFGNLPDSATNQAANVGSYADTITVSVTY